MNNVLGADNYVKIAEEIVSDFLEKKSDLNSGILKVAEDMDLNPDQIKRLVEQANTQTFLKMFGDKEVKDKNIDFDVADPKKILSSFYGKPGNKSIQIKIGRAHV